MILLYCIVLHCIAMIALHCIACILTLDWGHFFADFHKKKKSASCGKEHGKSKPCLMFFVTPVTQTNNTIMPPHYLQTKLTVGLYHSTRKYPIIQQQLPIVRWLGAKKHCLFCMQKPKKRKKERNNEVSVDFPAAESITSCRVSYTSAFMTTISIARTGGTGTACAYQPTSSGDSELMKYSTPPEALYLHAKQHTHTHKRLHYKIVTRRQQAKN